MKNNPLLIELLESRIAPAVLVNGGNLLGGTGNPTTGETSSGGNTVTLVKVLHGQALVFFDSATAQITGISVGQGTKLDLTGNVYGDIVTNLLPTGRLTDSDNNPANGEDGGILLPDNIRGIATHKLGSQDGDIGRIIAGGSVKNINVTGELSGIYAGDGIFRDGDSVTVSTGSVDYNSIQIGAQTAFVLTKAAAQPASSASVDKVAVFTANQLEIFAGDGFQDDTGKGEAGGSITNVTITKTLSGEGSSPALSLRAGDGGEGTTGGAGGSITNFDDLGSIAYVKVQTGDGGVGDSDHGGAGGSLTASSITTSSPRYDLLMGHGGDGATLGGAGGSISSVTFNNDVNGGKSLVATGDFNNDGQQDVLLLNTLTGEATLSLGTASTGGAVLYNVALQPKTNPDGSAATTPFIAAEGAVPTGVATADFNGDGNLDFVVSYASTDNLGVFLGHGDGTFTGSSVALGFSPSKIAVADFAGNTAPDIAVLNAGVSTSASGSANSRIFVVQNDGTAHFTLLGNPTTVAGVGTDLVTAQIDKTGGNDLFVGLASGSIDTLLDNGTSFTAGPTIAAFADANGYSAPVTNLDVGSSSSTTTALLAFTANLNVNDANLTAVLPQVNVYSIGTSGAVAGFNLFQPDDAASTAAHFVRNTDTIGVVANDALSLYAFQTATGYAQVASVTSDGVLNDFIGSSGPNGYQLIAVGAATNRFFYTTGDPTSATGLPVFQPINTPFEPRVVSFVGGDGGHGSTDVGGAGGSVTSLTYTQTLGGGVQEAGGTYETHVTSGSGGASDQADGGAGGTITKVSLSLNAGYQNVQQDDTTSAYLTTGHGGAGTDGGAGGSVSKITEASIFTQTLAGGPYPGSVTMQIVSGAGGTGLTGAGGAGGAITLDGAKSLSGITYYDPSSPHPEDAGLQVQTGNGGDGVSAGGAGGALTDVGVQNAVFSGANLNTNELASALVQSGTGGNASAGNGGAGGLISGLSVAVQSVVTDPGTIYAQLLDGTVTVVSGSGGNGTGGVGGNAGVVSKSAVASLTGDSTLGYGVLVVGGAGGDGDFGGGKGGGIKSITMNTASTNDAFAAVLVGGHGGAATVSGTGGRGGTINGVTQSKDVNSTINTIAGGAGGASADGAGGAGGSVKSIDTEGFIGLPSVTNLDEGVYLGVFNDAIVSPTVASLFATGTSVPQGIFAGRGADGGNNGSVFDVVARQVAAIAATPDANGLFAPVRQITGITADLIGYDANQDGVFDSTAGQGVSPETARPIDGFLLASTFGTITTTTSDARTAAFEFSG